LLVTAGILNDVLIVAGEAAWIGVVATLVTDLWQRLLQATAGVPPAPWKFVGRWVVGMSRGVFVNPTIAATPPAPGEDAIGWAFHYAVGVVYAALYALILRWMGSGPSLLVALGLALALLVAPWFVMQPALGLGFLATKAPRPFVTRTLSVSNHAIFGAGLYLGAVASPFSSLWP
jgi:hypothetical protein